MKSCITPPIGSPPPPVRPNKGILPAPPTTPGRPRLATIAVGDIHGNLAALDDLLARLLPEVCQEDVLVFLGDYIDRGPDSQGVLNRLAALRASPPCDVRFLLGNHEEWLLKTMHDHTSHSWLVGMEAITTIASYSRTTALQMLAAARQAGMGMYTGRVALPYERFFRLMPRAHLDLLGSLWTFVRTDDVVCVHGGVPLDDTPLDRASQVDLVWGSSGFPGHYAGTDSIVYGHWNDCPVGTDDWPTVRITGRAYGIDTISHGVLTALRFPDLKIFQSGRYLVDSDGR
jgi:serine/threonine protein phosphatase 1